MVKGCAQSPVILLMSRVFLHEHASGYGMSDVFKLIENSLETRWPLPPSLALVAHSFSPVFLGLSSVSIRNISQQRGKISITSLFCLTGFTLIGVCNGIF